MKPERMSRSVEKRIKRQRSWADLEVYVRAAWNSAHAQRDIASSYPLKREYDGRIAALEGIALRLGIDLQKKSSHEA